MGRAIKCFRAIFGLSNEQHHNQKAKKWIIFGKKSSKQSRDFQHKQSTQSSAVLVGKKCNDEDDVEEEIGHDTVGSTANVSQGRTGYGENTNMSRREHRAAVVVQSHFRGYLARRALRALRGLVKLQALARGHLARKQTADALRRLQSLIRTQDKIYSVRVNTISESPRSRLKSSPFHYMAPPTTPSYENRSSRRKSKLKTSTTRGEIVECCQSFSTSKDSLTHQSPLSPSSAEVQSFSHNLNSPRFCSSSSVGGNSNRCRRETQDNTPTRSEGTRSCSSNYSHLPNYMAYTESSKAKVRPLSVQRPRRQAQFEASSSENRYIFKV